MASAHSGCTLATVRAHNRLVSTSSAAITHFGCLRDSTEPLPIANFEPCAPWYSRLLRSAVPSRIPRWLSRPASSAWWMRSGWLASLPGRMPS